MGSILEMLKGRGQSSDAGSQAGGKRQERKKTTKAKPKAKPTKRTEKSKATQQKAKYTPPKPKIKIKPKPPIKEPGSEWGKSGEKAWVAAGVKDFVANNRKWGATGDKDRFGILNQFGEKSRLQPLQSLPKVFSSGRP